MIFLIFCFRGFESETDTEEFEKVGQSPTEMGFEKRVDSAKEVRLYSGCDIVTWDNSCIGTYCFLLRLDKTGNNFKKLKSYKTLVKLKWRLDEIHCK